jgi:ribosomal-protein-alanine N-acetyltransferase
MEFETARLIVRRIDLGDAGFMLALLNDPGFLANIGDRGVRTIEQAREYVCDRVLAVYPAGVGMLLVSRKRDGEAVGTVGFVRRDGLDHPDLGFAYLAEHCGQGYGGEAARGLLDHAPEIRPLLAVTQPDNLPSGAVLRKLGFVEDGMVTLPSHDEPSRLFRLVA